MKDFNSLCKEFEQMNPLTYQEYILKKSAEIVPILSATAENGVAGTVIFFSFVLGAIAADGKLSEEEYNEISDNCRKTAMKTTSYEACVKKINYLYECIKF